jgi:hypothetical protein
MSKEISNLNCYSLSEYLKEMEEDTATITHLQINYFFFPFLLQDNE